MGRFLEPVTYPMQHYELVSVLTSTLSDTDIPAVTQKIRDLIAKGSGTVAKEQVLGRRTLGFPIRKQSQGTYVVLTLDMPTDKVAAFNRELGLMPEMLRHQILQTRVKTEQQLAAEIALREKIQAKRQRVQAEAKAEAQAEHQKEEAAQPVDVAALEKKLDTVLDDDMLKE